jgi:hypothetical protein
MTHTLAWLGSAGFLMFGSLAAAGPHVERPLAVGVHGQPQSHETRQARPVRLSGILEVSNISHAPLFVEVGEQGFWLGPWEDTTIRVQAGSVNIDSSVSRRGQLRNVEVRTVWVEPGSKVALDLRRTRVAAPVRWGVAVHSGGLHVWGPPRHRHHGHHHRHW